ncbi:MAG: tRNA (adenosine(37)-N6)-dimethylallyltransferase MiaA [Deltaproteobacteria bacterium GWA2_45_12]|nr:MAG: tRNA (adenosine(37)-N6)-dimethylallyltransferase MiaA [Deltaproteobacteria bacterium GWA2_45_12]
MNKFVVILGPTATGKTSLAISLCKKFKGEIISVDSRQAYREMEIGTGKATIDNGQVTIDKGDTPIHLYDVVGPDERLNAFEFSNLAWEKVEEIWSGNKVPFLVGGTGFYLDVILGRRKLSNISADPALRFELEGLSTLELIEKLKKLSPPRLEAIDQYNRYRLMRAIEVEEGIKSQELRVKGEMPRDFKCLIIGLTAENDRLYEIADGRVDRMMEVGLLDEVKRLSEKYGWEVPGLKTLGYREFLPYFEGKVLLSGAVQKLKYNTHAYIRRQKTYFRKNTDIKWFDITDCEFDKVVSDAVESFLL